MPTLTPPALSLQSCGPGSVLARVIDSWKTEVLSYLLLNPWPLSCSPGRSWNLLGMPPKSLMDFF